MTCGQADVFWVEIAAGTVEDRDGGSQRASTKVGTEYFSFSFQSFPLPLGNSLFWEPTYSGSVIECDPQGTVKDHPEPPSDLLLGMAEIYHRRGP